MKKIGQGWQYTVYDTGSGRVIKKLNSWTGAAWVISVKIFPFNQYPFWKIPAYIKSAQRKALMSQEILRNKKLPDSWFAYPKFISATDYEQDKVIPIKRIFTQSSFEESKKVIDAFTVFNQKLLRAGVIDKYFNIANNFGVNNKNEIVLMDLGELIDNPQKILELRKKRIWSVDYGNIENKDIQRYFIDQMDKYFSL